MAVGEVRVPGPRLEPGHELWGQPSGLGRAVWLPGPNHTCQSQDKRGLGCGVVGGRGEAWRLQWSEAGLQLVHDYESQWFGSGLLVPDTPPWGLRSGPGTSGWVSRAGGGR